MSFVKYHVGEDFGELISLYQSEGALCFELECEDAFLDGARLKLGACTLPFKGKRATATPTSLPEGIIRPLLILKDGRSIGFEPIKKLGKNFSALPTEEAVIRGMLARIRRQEARIVALEKKLEQLTDKVGREIVF